MDEVKSIHLVFPFEFKEGMTEELEIDGFEIINYDETMDTFADWAETDADNIADVALVHGLSVTGAGDTLSQKQSIYNCLKRVREHKENLRMVIIFPEDVQSDKDFVSKIAQLMIYDIYFTDELNLNDMTHWLRHKKGYKHVSKILEGYKSHDRKDYQNASEIKVELNDTHPDSEDHETKHKQETKQKPSADQFLQEKKILKQIQSVASRSQGDVRTVYRSFASKLITVTSVKGGVGKTDISLNLAKALQINTNVSKICLVDYDFPYGGIASALNLKRHSDLGDWMLKETDHITEEGLKNRVVQHEGIDIIPMSLNIRDNQEFQSLHSEIMIDILKRYYDIVIIDTSGFSQPALVAIERASEVLMITSHDIVSLSTSIAYKEDLLNLYGINHEKISLFINQVPVHEDIKKQAIAEAFEDHESQTPVIGYAPYDDKVRQHRNKGVFIYEALPHHSFSTGIDMILEQLDIVSDNLISKKNRASLTNGVKEKASGFLSAIKNRKVTESN